MSLLIDYAAFLQGNMTDEIGKLQPPMSGYFEHGVVQVGAFHCVIKLPPVFISTSCRAINRKRVSSNSGCKEPLKCGQTFFQRHDGHRGKVPVLFESCSSSASYLSDQSWFLRIWKPYPNTSQYLYLQGKTGQRLSHRT